MCSEKGPKCGVRVGRVSNIRRRWDTDADLKDDPEVSKETKVYKSKETKVYEVPLSFF